MVPPSTVSDDCCGLHREDVTILFIIFLPVSLFCAKAATRPTCCKLMVIIAKVYYAITLPITGWLMLGRHREWGKCCRCKCPSRAHSRDRSVCLMLCLCVILVGSGMTVVYRYFVFSDVKCMWIPSYLFAPALVLFWFVRKFQKEKGQKLVATGTNKSSQSTTDKKDH